MNIDRATGTPNLLARCAEGVLTLTLARPEARNALTHGMVAALGEQLSLAELDDDIRCVVLTGEGKGFCAGGDVKGMAENDHSRGGGIDALIHQQRVFQRATAGALFTMPKPTIAAINGPAAGAGLALALACDFRVMASNAFLVTAFANVGLSGDFGGTYFLTQLLGAAKARELFFLSERVPSEEALRLGLANRVCAPDGLAGETGELARRLVAGPAVAYRYMKENLNRAMSGTVVECLDLEATHHIHCSLTADHREAAASFVEKRSPVFKGR